MNVLPALIVIGLLVYAVIDCAQTPAEELRFGRGLWFAIVVLIPVVGPVAWLVYGRTSSPRRHAHANANPEPPAPAGHPVGPDDDPEFLAELNRARRRPEPPKPPRAEKPQKPQRPEPDQPRADQPTEPVDEPIDPDA